MVVSWGGAAQPWPPRQVGIQAGMDCRAPAQPAAGSSGRDSGRVGCSYHSAITLARSVQQTPAGISSQAAWPWQELIPPDPGTGRSLRYHEQIPSRPVLSGTGHPGGGWDPSMPAQK